MKIITITLLTLWPCAGAAYELNTTADSDKAPGAGPTIVLGPAGVAARFVIAGKDLNRNVKQTASKIAAEVVQRTKSSLLSSNTQI